MCVRHKLFPYEVKFGKTVEHSKVLNVLKKKNWIELNWIECSCKGKAKAVEHSNLLNVLEKHWMFMKRQNEQNLLNIHEKWQNWTLTISILWCMAKVIPKNLSHLERAEHMEHLVKDTKLKLLQCKRQSMNVHEEAKHDQKLNVLNVCLCTWK